MYLCGALPALLGLALLVAAQTPAPKPTPLPGQEKGLPAIEVPRIVPGELPAQCQQARERAGQLRAELEASLSAQAKAAAEQYAAKPGPGVSPEKAWGDYAAAALLMGNVPVAAWAGLKAAEIRWNGETVTNAGIYLYHLGKLQEALQLLNCAYAMGYRSPFLLEALAVVHHKLGDVGQARQEIQQARELAPDDRIIETETSFMTTGQPPPPPPPDRSDALDDALRELEAHAQTALNLMKLQADEIDRDLPDAQANKYYQISADYFAKLIQIARDQAQQARAADPARRQLMINMALSMCVSNYAQISDTLLKFPDTIETSGSPLLFWAEVLGLDAPVLARESHRDAIAWAMHGGGPALAQGASDDYRRDLDAARKEHYQRQHACRDNPCLVREDARFCGVWKPLYETWGEASRQRHNTAARAFDRIATRYVIQAENQYLELRDYAVRQLKKMRFQKTPGFNMEEMTLKGINATIQPVYQHHLSPTADTMGTVAYLRERARWFEDERSGMEEQLASEAEEMQRECEPAIRALLELLAQEEWQAYLDHLKDRLAWDVQPHTEDEWPCEGSLGPITVSTDLNELGSGKSKFDLKWKPTLSQFEGGKISGSAGVSVGVGGQGSEGSIGGSGSYGPFAGKVKATLTNKVNPWNSREYTGIKLKGSAGFGLKSGKLGAACYPSSGSVTIYPRAFYEDAAKYMSTPSSPPPGGRPR